MNDFFLKAKSVWADTAIRSRILFVLLMFVIFRLGDAIPIPGVDPVSLNAFLSSNGLFGLLNIFSGGGLSSLSIFMLGVGPYITGSIIMQLLTMVFPSLKAKYQEEGEAGRRKFAQYSRYLAVPLAMLQGFSLLVLLKRQGVLGAITFNEQLLNVLVVTAGSLLLMWLGELITEYGIGNGVSLIIFAGIVSRIPTQISRAITTFAVTDIPVYLLFAVASILVVGAVVIMTEAERPIPVTYAKRVRGNKVYGGVSTYLPLRVNQAGVMPIIFALSILLFPQLVATFLSGIDHPVVQQIGDGITYALSNQWIYSAVYFVFVFLFTYFYTAVTFDPDTIANNLQKSGAFIPGIRPGQPTAEYLATVVTRITFVGAVFLSLIAVLPLVMQAVTGNALLAIGGTALLIVVSVVLDLVRQLDAQASLREY